MHVQLYTVVVIVIVTRDFYSAHNSEFAGTSLFTGAYPNKIDRQQVRSRESGRQADSQTAMVEDGVWI